MMMHRFKTLAAVSLVALMAQGPLALAVEGDLESTLSNLTITSPTSSEARCQVLRTYYGENPDNQDPSIFDHFKAWHDQDLGLLKARIQAPENRDLLQEISDAMKAAFQAGTMNYAKLGMGYYLYSLVLDKEIDKAGELEGEDSVGSVIRYIRRNVVPSFFDIPVFSPGPAAEPMPAHPDDVSRTSTHLFDVCVNKGIRCLSIVSNGNLSTFRTLNESFGLRTPILEMPLADRTAYDGIQDEPPSQVFGHDIRNHMASDISSNFDTTELKERFDLYRTMNDIIRGIADPKKQFIADYFLFELGHEGEFDDQELTVFNSADSGKPIFEQKALTADRFDAVCDDILDKKAKALGSFLTECAVGGGENVPGSYLPQFINPETNKLYSLEGLFKVYDLDRTKPLSLSMLRESGKFNLPADDKDWGFGYATYSTDRGFFPWQPEDVTRIILSPGIADTEQNRHEAFNRGALKTLLIGFASVTPLGAYTYNALLEIQGYLQSMGLDFQVWNGDKINVEGLSRFYRNAAETFKREVGDTFKATYRS